MRTQTFLSCVKIFYDFFYPFFYKKVRIQVTATTTTTTWAWDPTRENLFLSCGGFWIREMKVGIRIGTVFSTECWIIRKKLCTMMICTIESCCIVSWNQNFNHRMKYSWRWLNCIQKHLLLMTGWVVCRCIERYVNGKWFDVILLVFAKKGLKYLFKNELKKLPFCCNIGHVRGISWSCVSSW